WDLPRADFVHWVLVDIDPTEGALQEGEFSKGVTKKGKAGPESARSTRSGLNDYTSWFAGDPGMEGKYYGYDGPFPPWNDARRHRYRFTIYALDFQRCPVEGTFTIDAVRKAIEGHILAQAEFVGTYHIYPDAR
ncbi:MAG TPA: YbhB/YbcL family Raf kinase inhibitor-like protein, partial [Polyangiaceae bacterium]